MQYNKSMSSKKTITKDDVLHIANLARLTLSEKEVDLYARQLEDVLSNFVAIGKIDTSHVPSTSHPIDLQNITFQDGKQSEQQLKVLTDLKTKDVSGKKYFSVDRVL